MHINIDIQLKENVFNRTYIGCFNIMAVFLAGRYRARLLKFLL